MWHLIIMVTSLTSIGMPPAWVSYPIPFNTAYECEQSRATITTEPGTLVFSGCVWVEDSDGI